MRCAWLLPCCAAALCLHVSAQSIAPDGWRSGAPRDEIRPAFAYEAEGGPERTPALAIKADRAGVNGYWRKTFPVVGGDFYRFSTLFKVEQVTVPRRSVLVEIVWQDVRGRTVPTDIGSVEPELP